ncbi:MAG: GntR family transcriptional regulator [Acidobacteriaceae bacterium]|nr:GntR family transcriptional regulator [Acidobacteriaceae bacterium]
MGFTSTFQKKIASGELPPGSPISELALSKELGLSRTPIREAIGQLVSEGLLEQIPNRRAVVVKLSRRDITDLFELREALEVYAVGKASRLSLRPTDLERLQNRADEVLALQKELERTGSPALNAGGMHRFILADLAFHTLLMRLADNARILKLVNETRLLIRVFAMYRSGHTADELASIYKGHCDILKPYGVPLPHDAAIL